MTGTPPKRVFLPHLADPDPFWLARFRAPQRTGWFYVQGIDQREAELNAEACLRGVEVLTGIDRVPEVEDGG